MSTKQIQPTDEEGVENTPNYVLWIVGTILATAGLVFIQRNLSDKGESKKEKVYTGAADYLHERNKQIRNDDK